MMATVCFRQRCSRVTSANLEAHTRIHEGKNPYQCPQCTKSFSGLSMLKSHIAAKHDKVQFKCPDCERLFETSELFRKHRAEACMRIMPFRCSYPGCSYEAATRSSITKHMKREHMVEKFKCPFCKFESIKIEKIRNHVFMLHQEKWEAYKQTFST